jgi:endonuclease III
MAPIINSMTAKENAQKTLAFLKKEYPNANTALSYSTVFELLVATILSAQCTDKRVNLVTPALFKKYKKINDYASADIHALEQDVRSTGFYHTKAKNIQGAARMVLSDFNGKVPDTMDMLTRLPGVARKTANIVLTHGFGKVEGIAVDTHVKRVSKRLGLTGSADPVKIERDLMQIVPKADWCLVSDLFILHGRNVCSAAKPKCGTCVLNKFCPTAPLFLSERK